MKIDDKHDITMTMKTGHQFKALHKDKRWFIISKFMKCNQLNSKISNSSSYVSAYAMKSHSDPALSSLWHACFGHVAMRRIMKLFENPEEYGLPNEKISRMLTCEDCIRCKSTSRRVLGRTNHEVGILEVVVSDVAGPFVPCLTGEKLMVTFREAGSTFSDFIFIKQKSEVGQHFMSIIKKWERETGVKVKKIRTDRGGEYISSTFDKWLKSEGIQHEFSNPYEPEQKGLAERLNRTIGDMARTLLMAAKLP